MPVLVVGKTRIPYEIRESSRAKRKRIVVTPEKVEVVLPEGQGKDQADAFIRSRRRWVYEQREELQHRMARMLDFGPEKLSTGSKVAYRGRMVRLNVAQEDRAEIEVRYRSGFRVRKGIAHSEHDVASALRTWLRSRAKEDVSHLIRRYSTRHCLSPKGVRVVEMKRRWGSCSENGVLQINWRLILAPRPVLEYAVVHELCHLKHRSHNRAFWSLVGEVLPSYQVAKSWLEANEHRIELVN